ncbi:MAG: hypothetical protein R2824_00150 [Saprospiraceae bacterium]|nr:hypothetical protein [Lewinella sp.]
MRQTLLNHIKNIPGRRIKRKLVVISVDDYGNVRLDSRKARETLNRAGMKIHSRFDAYDSLETREDLEALFETLTAVKDQNNRPAIFTPFTLPCNINFEKVAEQGFERYHYETLPDTYTKLEARDAQAYSGAWRLWREGIENGLMKPQFHGREHLNLKVFEEKLAQKDKEVLTALKNRSYTSISNSGYPTIGWTAAFAFDTLEDIRKFPSIVKTGMDAFEDVFGFRSESFTPPAQQFPLQLERTLSDYGIRHLDKPFIRKRHLGGGKYRREVNVMERERATGLNILVRNVVFEPTNGQVDHIGKAMQQVKAAFRMHKPAIISSHRVNFCGHIDPQNRERGLNALKTLLQKIVRTWPEVEFISASELGSIIAAKE